MLVDLIRLPNRYGDFDDSFSTMLPYFKYKDCVDDVDCAGRKVDLATFANDAVCKYKSIEFENDTVIEKLLIIDDEIDTTKKFWTSNRKIYPLQAKRFSYADPMGFTFKYVNGISEFNRDYIHDVPLVPLMHFRKHSLPPNPVYQFIVPQTDINLLYRSDKSIVEPNVDVMDNWVCPEAKMNSLFRPTGIDFRTHQGECSRDSTIYPFDMGMEVCNTDCLNFNWDMYELITRMNDLGVSDIRIELDARTNRVDIGFSSRYNGFFDYKHFPQYHDTVWYLEKLARDVMKTRFGEVPWVHAVFEKLWTEEVYITIDVECPHRSSSIPTYYYIDLVAFILGTVGLTYSTIKH